MSTQLVNVLDLATVPVEEQRTTVSTRFAELPPGGEFVFLTTEDPQPLLQQFQTQHPDDFDWWPLERGPTQWRVHVAKPGPDTERPRTLTNLMCADHQRLDRLYARLYKALEAANLELARALITEFEVGLLRHIAAEEDILMPFMAERCGHRGVRDAAQMHEEHERIQQAFRTAKSAVAAAGATASRDAMAALTEMRFILEGHNQNEERMLYPISDLESSSEQRREMIARIQKL